MISVIFPGQFSKILGSELLIRVSGSTIKEVIENVCISHEPLRKHLFLESGALSPFVAFCLSSQDLIHSSSEADSVKLKDGDSIEVLMSMAGG